MGSRSDVDDNALRSSLIDCETCGEDCLRLVDTIERSSDALEACVFLQVLQMLGVGLCHDTCDVSEMLLQSSTMQYMNQKTSG